MGEDVYPFLKVPDEYYYEFYSEGPKGIIKKIIRYRLIQEGQIKVYNLGFGDWNEQEDDVDDLINSNNQDRQRVLATVANTVLDFLNAHPYAVVFARGSTASRTRLYQMNIAAFSDVIAESFIVMGYINGQWQVFKKGINFDAFSIRKKI